MAECKGLWWSDWSREMRHASASPTPDPEPRPYRPQLHARLKPQAGQGTAPRRINGYRHFSADAAARSRRARR